MSKLDGHYRITFQAVSELGGGNIMARLLGASVVARDIKDVVSLGHWGDHGQSNHFMRKFNGQSEHQAYLDGIQWIKKNTEEAVKYIVSQSNKNPYVSLGNACHALQDSFARGHVHRTKSNGVYNPGDIIRVLKYAGKDKEHHAHHDKTWEAKAGGFSDRGRLAVNATKALFELVRESITFYRTGEQIKLVGWQAFINQWLSASPNLNKNRDDVVDIINQYTVNIGLGDMNFLTGNMDEAGLARDIADYGVDTEKVHSVFTRLKTHYQSDADDVALIYVQYLQKTSSAKQWDIVKQDKKLVALLIRLLDEGWTSGSEKAAINFLSAA